MVMPGDVAFGKEFHQRTGGRIICQYGSEGLAAFDGQFDGAAFHIRPILIVGNLLLCLGRWHYQGI